MGKVFKVIRRLAAIFGLVYGVLFAVFYFDLDGKFLYYFVEPFLVRHYDRMERKDPLKQQYDVNKPRYEYD